MAEKEVGKLSNIALNPLRGMPRNMRFDIETSETRQQVLILTATGVNGSTRDYKELGFFSEDLTSIPLPKLLAFCTNACNALLMDLMYDFSSHPSPEWIKPVESE